MSLSLIANIIALLVLLSSGIYELFLRKYLFDKRVKAGMSKSRSFLMGQRIRSNITYVILFLMLISMMFAIISNFKESEMSGFEKAKTYRKISGMERRLKRIEDYLWPEKVNGSPDPIGGPPGPSGPSWGNGMREIEDRLEKIEAKATSNTVHIETIFRELNELKEQNRAFSRLLHLTLMQTDSRGPHITQAAIWSRMNNEAGSDE